jgi:hypothetical protein
MRDARAKTASNTGLLEKSKTLLKMKVYGGASPKAKPYIEWRQGNTSTPIYGNQVSCRVAVEQQFDGLRVCFEEGLLETKDVAGASYELARDLAEFCGSSKHSYLMGRVLHENDPQQIEELLTKHGVGPSEDEKITGEVTVELASAKGPERTGGSSKSVGFHENSAEGNVVKVAPCSTNHEKDSSDDCANTGRPAINGQVKAGKDSESVLQQGARAALRSSLKKAKVDGVVPSMKICRTSEANIISRVAKSSDDKRLAVGSACETVRSEAK